MLFSQLQQVPGTGPEFVVIDRTVQEVGGAGFERLQTELALFIHGNDDYRHLGKVRLRAQAPRELRAVHAGHLEISNDQVGRVALHAFQCGVRI